MAKKIITISREFGSGGRFIGEEVALIILQKSQVCLRIISRKKQSCLRRKDYLHMHL